MRNLLSTRRRISEKAGTLLHRGFGSRGVKGIFVRAKKKKIKDEVEMRGHYHSISSRSLAINI